MEARLVANLLDNAIRHNVPQGFVEVVTRTAGDHVHLSVTNGGERIDPAEAAGLTEPFRRRNRAVPGFGLGLSMVRSVVQAHSGEGAGDRPVSGRSRGDGDAASRLRALSLSARRVTYQASMLGRRLPGCCHQAGAAGSNRVAIQRELSAGSITSSISK